MSWLLPVLVRNKSIILDNACVEKSNIKSLNCKLSLYLIIWDAYITQTTENLALSSNLIIAMLKSTPCEDGPGEIIWKLSHDNQTLFRLGSKCFTTQSHQCKESQLKTNVSSGLFFPSTCLNRLIGWVEEGEGRVWMQQTRLLEPS